MKTVRDIIWGVVFIIIGIIVGLNALDIINIDIFFDGWWTLFIIIPSFIGLFKSDHITGNVIGLFIGGFCLLACQDVITFEVVWKLTIPVVLITIGLSILLRDVFESKTKEMIKKISKNTDKSYCATFSSQNIDLDDQLFEGCNIEAVFGEVKFDMRKAIIKEDVVINATAVFGSVDIYVPANVIVKTTSTSIFGGGDCKHMNSTDKKAKTIYVNMTNVFGGVDIK